MLQGCTIVVAHSHTYRMVIPQGKQKLWTIIFPESLSKRKFTELTFKFPKLVELILTLWCKKYKYSEYVLK